MTKDDQRCCKVQDKGMSTTIHNNDLFFLDRPALHATPTTYGIGGRGQRLRAKRIKHHTFKFVYKKINKV